jgi:hypothetical protein
MNDLFFLTCSIPLVSFEHKLGAEDYKINLIYILWKLAGYRDKMFELWRHPVDRTCSAGVPSPLMKGPIHGIPLRIRHLKE